MLTRLQVIAAAKVQEKQPHRRRAIRLVEAAGVEPAPGQRIISLMAHDLRRNRLITRSLVGNLLCSGVPFSPLESAPVLEIYWRRWIRPPILITEALVRS